MEPEVSLPSSLIPIMSQINLVRTTPSYLSHRSASILHTHLPLGLPNGLFSSGFPTNIRYAFHFSPIELHALPISSSYTCLFWLYLAKNASYKAPHYAVFSNLLSLHLSSSAVGSRYQAAASGDHNRLRTLVFVWQWFVKCNHKFCVKVFSKFGYKPRPGL
jgi:hypothetical protein